MLYPFKNFHVFNKMAIIFLKRLLQEQTHGTLLSSSLKINQQKQICHDVKKPHQPVYWVWYIFDDHV